MTILVIYHDRCPDGAAAAWCARQYYGEESCLFHPAMWGQDPPLKKARKCEKTFCLDFSYDREKIQRLAEVTNLLVLDHHKSAEARLHGLDYCQIDMKRSGCGMAWDHFFPNEERPWFIDYIEDRDIWKWEYGNSREALAFLDTMPKTFDTYDRFFNRDIELGDCVHLGAAIVQYLDQYNKESIAASLRYIDFQAPNGDIHMGIPIVNVSYKGISEIGNIIAQGHPFGLGWFRRHDGKYQFSLRVAEDSDFDGAKLAALYGGGGHRKAAGFSLDHELEELPTTAIEEKK